MMRSLLFVPADSENKLAKAESIPADGIVIDLEDSVAPQNKERARGLAREYLQGRQGERAQSLWVRMNPVFSPEAGADLAAVMPVAPDGIMLPKARSVDDVELLGQRLGTYEAEYERQVGATLILPIVTETPGALFGLGDYAKCGKRLAALTWGAEDLASAIGASRKQDDNGEWTPPFQWVRSLCLFAAHAATVTAVDTLFADFRDAEGLQKSCATARRDGFHGKLAIHPGQVEIINRSFTPDADEVDHARAIVELFAANPGAGTLALDGVMVDLPHLQQAQHILAMAEAAASKPTE